MGELGLGGAVGLPDPERYDETKSIRCCPMASRPADPSGSVYPPVGGTFLAWGRFWPVDADYVPEPYNRYSAHGSYGFNGALGRPWRYGHDPGADMYERVWRTADIRRRGRIPVYYDCAWPISLGVGDGCADPPECDAVPTAIEAHAWTAHCLDRHNGGINMLFLDWSVRKVGLKELWTLKWHRQFQTAGPWTKSGGVEPGDWPQWMRSFRDY